MTNYQLEPARFHSDNFGYKEGDVCAAYSADVYPKIRTPFKHDGKLFTAGNYCNNRNNGYYADCYELTEVEKGTADGSKIPYSYENKIVQWKGKTFRLGPKIEFRSRPETEAEIKLRCRRQYAHGGWFASQAGCYSALMLDWGTDSRSTPFQKLVYLTEAANPTLPQTQSAMREYLKEAA